MDFVKVFFLVSLIIIVALVGVEVKNKVDSFEIPDLSKVNELINKVEPLLDFVNELNDPLMKYYIREGKDFLRRLDEIQGSDLMITLLPAMNKSYNEVIE